MGEVFDEEADATAAAVPRRAAARSPTRQQPVRAATRVPGRQRASVEGRGGELLTRRRTQLGDTYSINERDVPTGWSYQWNPVTVLNKQVEGSLVMHENGWRPVPASRHPGRWTPDDFKGAIVVDGLRLEERPMSLTIEAQEDDRRRAKMQIRDQTDSLRLTQKQLPGSKVARNRNFGGGMRMEIDPGLDIPLPQHPLGDEG